MSRLASLTRPVAAQDAPPVVAVAAAVPAAVPAQAFSGGQAGRQAEDALRSRIREAVQEAVRCPAAARMMHLSGKVGVGFDYRDGALVGAVQIERSSGTPILDAAAAGAVRIAHYPSAPPETASQILRLLIWVDEACDG